MSITISCSNCGREIKAKEKYAGKRVKCPGCETPMLIPVEAGSPQPALQSDQPPPLRTSPTPPADVWRQDVGAPAGTIGIKCPKCFHEKHIKANFAGQRVKCPSCRQPIDVPAATPSTAPRPDLAAIGTPVELNELPDPLPSFAPDTQLAGVAAGGPAAAVLLEVDDPPWTPPQWGDDDDDLPPGVPALPVDSRSSVFGEPQRAGVGRRMVGYILDVLPTLLLFPLPLIPIIGPMMFGIALLVYWLLRDIRGASLGKWAMGMEVRMANGGPALGGKCVMRNVTLAIGPTCSVIQGILTLVAVVFPPLMVIVGYLGLIVVFGISFCVIMTELAFLLFTGRRIGERLAGTIVVLKPPMPG